MQDSVIFRLPDGTEHHLGVADGRFTDTPTDGPTLDLSGLHVVRGLVDAHAHFMADDLAMTEEATSEHRAWAQVEAGVFLVLEKGAADRAQLRILEQPPDRRPDLEMAGMIIHPPEGYYPAFSEREVAAEDLLAEVAAQAEHPATWVKLIGDWPRRGLGPVTNYDGAALAAAVAVAHDAGCRVAIHAAAPETPSIAVAAGVDSIEHGLFLTAEDLVALGARGGAWVPTITAMEHVRDSLGEGSTGRALLDRGLANVAALLGGASEAGVTVLAGSDLGIPHGAVAVEASAFVRYGMDPTAAVHALTESGFQYTAAGPGLMAGAPADLVAFGADPREDVRILEQPVLVMRRGAVIRDVR